MPRSIAHVRGPIVLGVTVLSLAVGAPALGGTPAPSPESCATAWNRGASPAQKRSILHATGARVARTPGAASCTIAFVLPRNGLRIATGAVVAGPGGSSGVWSLRRASRLVAAAGCTPNARLDRGGVLHLL